jgi:hypothetical protein
MYRHHIDRYSLPDEPLDPSEFVQRLAAALGSDSAMALVVQAFATVEATGKADGWIVEVGRAREQGVVSSELAHFLIWELAESAMTQLIIKNPWLSMLNAQLERIEREHGLEEGESWDLEEAPPEWRAPYLEWEDAYDKLFMLTLLRNGEHEVFHEEGQYYIGRAEIFGL